MADKITNYSIKVIFKNGLKKRLGLQIAMFTFKHWDKNIKSFLPDDHSLKDARKVLKIARTHFPNQEHKIIKTIIQKETLNY